uniref:Uncharacterized protein n=1 Tax=Arundo donax TaxID=35708 RepID=A0A0A9C8S2_ARUDO
MQYREVATSGSLSFTRCSV